MARARAPWVAGTLERAFLKFATALHKKLRDHQQAQAHIHAKLVGLVLPEGVPDDKLLRLTMSEGSRRATPSLRYWRLDLYIPDDGIVGVVHRAYCFVDRRSGAVLRPKPNGQRPYLVPSGHVLDANNGLQYCMPWGVEHPRKAFLEQRKRWRELVKEAAADHG